MEVRIGIRDVAREVTLESDQTPDEVKQAVTDAVNRGEGVLNLTDDRGRTVVVSAAALAYVEIGPAGKGRVGFGSST